jgi:CHAT domain-containing protein
VVLLGADAAQSQWRRRQPELFRYLHFATCTDYSQAVQGCQQPFVLLGGPAPPPLGSGPLTLGDLLGLSLGAQLVVLDNGVIGRGQALAAGGVGLLARAFLYAGARSLLVNLWPVEPPAADQFYQQVYTSLEAGLDPREAVFQARRQLRQQQPAPWIWGAWQLWGDD